MGTRSRRNQLDDALDRLVAGEEPRPSDQPSLGQRGLGDLAPFLHPARAVKAAMTQKVDPRVASAHLEALRGDRGLTVVLAPPMRRRGTRFAAMALVGAIFLTLGAGSAVAASSGALPGDPLYGLKRAVERISLAMHRDAGSRASLCLEFAQTRLEEVQTLVGSGQDASGIVADFQHDVACAESEAEHAVALGQDGDALLAHVQEMISKHVDVLNTVLGKVSDQARDAIQRAIDNAKKAQDKVTDARSHTRGGGQVNRPATPPGKGGNAPSR
jgi:uncharacterized protein DUF5667